MSCKCRGAGCATCEPDCLNYQTPKQMGRNLRRVANKLAAESLNRRDGIQADDPRITGK